MQLLLSAVVTSVRVEVEGTGAASVEHDDIGVERLVVAETGSGLGVAAAGDEAWSRSSRWTSTRWCSYVVVAGSPGSALGPGTTLVGRPAGDAPLASNGIAGVGGWRGGCVGMAPRGRQGHAPSVTPSPHLPPWSGLGRRRNRRGEEDDPVARSG